MYKPSAARRYIARTTAGRDCGSFPLVPAGLLAGDDRMCGFAMRFARGSLAKPAVGAIVPPMYSNRAQSAFEISPVCASPSVLVHQLLPLRLPR